MTDVRAPSFPFSWDPFVRWFALGRVFRLAIQVRTLLLGSAGVLLTIFGWWCIAQLFSGSDDARLKSMLADYKSCPWTTAGDAPIRLPFYSLRSPRMGDAPGDAIIDPWSRLTAPVLQFFEVSQTFVGAAFLSLCILWAAAVWGVFGGALARGAVLQLTRDEPASPVACLRYSLRRFWSYFSAPLLPLCVVIGMAIPLALLIGLPMRMSLLIGGLLWPLALLAGLVGAILTAAMSVGWPLMHATIGAEGSDGFDALSRSYAYVYQRPIHYLLYGLAATILGFLGLMVVLLFASAVEALAAWSVSWGSGAELMQKAAARSSDLADHDLWGAKLIHFWNGLIDVVVLGFAFGYFWNAASAVYLLLRRDADEVQVDEVFLDDGGSGFGAPTMTTMVAESAGSADVDGAAADIATQPE